MDNNATHNVAVQEVPQQFEVPTPGLFAGFTAWKEKHQNKMLGLPQAVYGNRQGRRCATKKYADGRQKDQKWRKANGL